MLFFLVLLAALQGSGRTAWMEPAFFKLHLGMKQSDAVQTLDKSGWKVVTGKEVNHLVVSHSEGRTMTLMFGKRGLESIRFELVGFIPDVKKAFDERQTVLQRRLGPGKRPAPRLDVVLYEKGPGKVMVVMSHDKRTAYGKQGLGFLVVRYFDPPA